jgi:hypothetical protein
MRAFCFLDAARLKMSNEAVGPGEKGSRFTGQTSKRFRVA